MLFELNKKEIVKITESVSRVMSYVFIMHLLEFAIDGEVDFMNEKVIKTMIYFAVAILLYDLVIKKCIIPKEFLQ